MLKRKKKEESWRMVIFLMFLTSFVIAVFGIYIADRICQLSLNEAYYGYVRDCEAWNGWKEDAKTSDSAGSKSEKPVESSEKTMESNRGKPMESSSEKTVENNSEKPTENSNGKTVGNSRKKTWENLSRKYNDGIYQRSMRMVSTADGAYGNPQKKMIVLRKKV